MPTASLQRLHRRLQNLSNDLGVNFRILRYQGTVLNPNPYVKTQSIATLSRSQSNANVNAEGFEGYLVFMNTGGLAESGIPPTALNPAEEWELSEDGGGVFIPITIFNKPTFQSSRYVATFLRRISAANLILSYPVETGAPPVDDIDGNPIPPTTLQTLECNVSQGRGNPSNSIPGVTASSIYLEGRCTNPLQLPEEITPLRSLTAQLINPTTGAVWSGRFIVQATPQDQWEADTQAKGGRIEGWFTLGD